MQRARTAACIHCRTANSKNVAHDLAQLETVDPIVQDNSSVRWSRDARFSGSFCNLSRWHVPPALQAVVAVLKETNANRRARSIPLPCQRSPRASCAHGPTSC